MNGPIFIGGSGRSGKTLLRWILACHPRIAVSRRTELWARFWGRFGDLEDDENLERCVRAMLEREQISALGIDAARLRADLSRGERTYARLFALVHEQYAERCDKSRWGDQSPHNERYAELILASYPEARFLHLVRDPRDCFHAEVERGVRGPGAVGPTTAAWLRAAQLATANAARFPDAYRVIRYEALVTDPDATVREICAFLGERFDPSMLAMAEADRYDEQRASSPTGSPISPSFVGEYRDGLDRCDLAFIQTIAGRSMQRLGYQTDALRLTPAERIRCAAVWPLGITRVGARRTADVVHAGRGKLVAGSRGR